VTTEETRVVAEGEDFDVVVEGVPTAGYLWHLVEPPADNPTVTLLGESWEPARAKRVGGSAGHRFSFRAVRAGEVALVLRYRRPWEEKAVEERVIHVKVMARQG
jgi:predicted secreted protein